MSPDSIKRARRLVSRCSTCGRRGIRWDTKETRGICQDQDLRDAMAELRGPVTTNTKLDSLYVETVLSALIGDGRCPLCHAPDVVCRTGSKHPLYRIGFQAHNANCDCGRWLLDSMDKARAARERARL